MLSRGNFHGIKMKGQGLNGAASMSVRERNQQTDNEHTTLLVSNK